MFNKKITFGLISILLILMLSCNFVKAITKVETTPPSNPTNLQTTEISSETTSDNTQQEQTEFDESELPQFLASEVYLVSFADYPAESVKLPQRFAGGYQLPIDLSKIQNVNSYELSQEQKSLLTKNGFVVEAPKAGEFREFYQIYEMYRYLDDQPIFVTTDSVLHIYHLIFNKMLRDLEREYFFPYLKRLTNSLLQSSLQQFQQLKGTQLEEQVKRNLAYFTVADQLLGSTAPITPEVADLVNAELSLINAHEGPSISPIWDRPGIADDRRYIEDYTQYIPRGHYTLSDDLQRYFKAMMWYGRLTFRISDPFETQRALLLVQALRNAPPSEGIPAEQLWDNIYSPTTFIVGKADDLSSHEYGVVSDSIFGPNPDLQAFADEQQVSRFAMAIKKLPPPQINSMWVWIWQDRNEATPGMRFMGQRFTLDAYIFQQLIFRNVGTLEEPRDLPKALDVFAGMGSDEALKILTEMGETKYQNYSQQMEKVRKEVASLDEDSWTQSLYWAWLDVFRPLIQPKGEQFPPFMRTSAWNQKELFTALGSWTELKHDTILYAKQVMAEMGGGGPEEPIHGYVEPNPEVYAKLLALANMTFNGLQARGLLNETTRDNLKNIIDLLSFLKRVSESELANETLSDDDYWRISYYGGELEAMTIKAADQNDPNDRDLTDQHAALITDVATGNERILLEAVGQPTRIYVVLPDEPFRIAGGAVYTHYEFTAPLAERMTDEDWRAKVKAGDTPPLAQWTSNFIAP